MPPRPQGALVPPPAAFATIGSAEARKAEEQEATIAALRAENADLDQRLARAEEELVELRAQAPRAPDPAPLVAAKNHALLVNVPSQAVRVPSIPLRFSSIPAELRVGGRKKLVVWGVSFLVLLVVGAFVAGTLMSRMH